MPNADVIIFDQLEQDFLKDDNFPQLQIFASNNEAKHWGKGGRTSQAAAPVPRISGGRFSLFTGGSHRGLYSSLFQEKPH